VCLPEQQARYWKDRLERYVRQACDQLDIQRRGVHGFRATAACEFVDLKRELGYTEAEARKELAMWLGHNAQRTEVTYAYVPKIRRTLRSPLGRKVHRHSRDTTD
jgi:integrase